MGRCCPTYSALRIYKHIHSSSPAPTEDLAPAHEETKAQWGGFSQFISLLTIHTGLPIPIELCPHYPLRLTFWHLFLFFQFMYKSLKYTSLPL